MIFLDVTSSSRSSHSSGLMRVSRRLRESLGDAATPFAWDPQHPPKTRPGDWILSPEIFSPEERPGFLAFLQSSPARKAAVFHDAIPLRFPHITWPRSVARHPAYLKMLAGFDRILAVSATSRADLLGFWRWLGISTPPTVGLLQLGADFDGAPRRQAQPSAGGDTPLLLCTGILEPRKNQALLLGVCPRLWDEGLRFELHLVGRVNPHFGTPLARQAARLAHQYPQFHYHGPADDRALDSLHARARATLFPTLAEGCGLPLLESLWRGVPCLCSDLPVLRENSAGGGCLELATNDPTAWTNGIKSVLADEGLVARLLQEAGSRRLPSWADCASSLLDQLAS